MHRIIVNDYVNSTLTAAFLFVVVTMVVYGVLACLKAYRSNRPTVREYPEAHELTASDDAADIARA
jgi:carbon starvation protein